MVRRGPLHSVHHTVESLPPPVLLENKLASQEAQLEELVSDNHKLASSEFNLRQDVVAAQQKVDELREHIRSIQTEADIQIRIFSNKIAKAEADIRAGDNVRKELQEAHIQAQRLLTAKLDLIARIQHATKELDNSRADVNKLPEMHGKLDSLRQEHQRLRKTFEYEKGANIEKVEQMKILEKDLVGMAGEVERLRAQLSNVEKRASVPIPYSSPYMNPENLCPPAFYGNAGYSGSFGRPHLHTVGGGAPYASSGFGIGPPVISDTAVSVGFGGVAVGGPVVHDPVFGAGAGGVAVAAPLISCPVFSTGAGAGAATAGGVAVGATMISGPAVGTGAAAAGVAASAPVISGPAVSAGATAAGYPPSRGVCDSSHT